MEYHIIESWSSNLGQSKIWMFVSLKLWWCRPSHIATSESGALWKRHRGRIRGASSSRWEEGITGRSGRWSPTTGVGKCPMTWEYWTSPYSSHYRPYTDHGWVMFNGDMTNDPWSQLVCLSWMVPQSHWSRWHCVLADCSSPNTPDRFQRLHRCKQAIRFCHVMWLLWLFGIWGKRGSLFDVCFVQTWNVFQTWALRHCSLVIIILISYLFHSIFTSYIYNG